MPKSEDSRISLRRAETLSDSDAASLFLEAGASGGERKESSNAKPSRRSSSALSSDGKSGSTLVRSSTWWCCCCSLTDGSDVRGAVLGSAPVDPAGSAGVYSGGGVSPPLPVSPLLFSVAARPSSIGRFRRDRRRDESASAPSSAARGVTANEVLDRGLIDPRTKYDAGLVLVHLGGEDGIKKVSKRPHLRWGFVEGDNGRF